MLIPKKIAIFNTYFHNFISLRINNVAQLLKNLSADSIRNDLNCLLNRLILFWEDTDSGKPFIGTASVLVTRRRYVREVKPYSCLATRRVRAPSAVYFPTTGNHMLFWQEQGRGTWVIGGELLQGQSKV